MVLLFGAAVLRFHLAWWRGHLGDLLVFQSWAVGTDRMKWFREVQHLGNFFPNYPPLYPSLCRLLVWIHEAAALPGDIRLPIDDMTLEESRPIILLFKTPPIAADLAAAVIIFLWGRHERRPGLGLLVAAFYLFSPAILYDGAYYGQTDTILLALLIGSGFAYATRRPVLLGSSAMLAALLKAQAISVLPILAAAVIIEWRHVWQRRFAELFLGAALSFWAGLALAGLTGMLHLFYNGYFTIVGQYSRTSYNALNLWWIIHSPLDRRPNLADFPADSLRVAGLVTYRDIGLALFAAALALTIWRWRRAADRPASLVLACAASAWAFFNLCTEMHERYSVVAVGFTCLAALWERKWFAFGLLSSLTTMINITLACHFWYPPCRWLQFHLNWFLHADSPGPFLAISAIQVLMLPLVLDALWRTGSRGRTPAVNAR